MAKSYEMISMSTARVSRGIHQAHVYQWNRPLAPVNFRVVFWWDNGMRHEVVDGFKSFDAAIRHAHDMLPELPAPPVDPMIAEAEEAGRDAFKAISGRMSDAMRGAKSWPTPPRCPFRRPERIAAWERGYDAMEDAFNSAQQS